MTTGEFIKMLQEADPSGTAHIRMSEGIPMGAELKPGYWDGPYSYIDENGNWVYTTSGQKVDIWCTEIYDFISDKIDTYQRPSWNEIKAKFKFDLGYSIPEHRTERENSILKQAKESYDETIELHEKFRVDGEKRALENSEKGWRWFQNKEVDNKDLRPNPHHYYTWIVLDEDGKDQGSNLHNVEAVYKSGLFERLDGGEKPGYYEWIRKIQK